MSLRIPSLPRKKSGSQDDQQATAGFGAVIGKPPSFSTAAPAAPPAPAVPEASDAPVVATIVEAEKPLILQSPLTEESETNGELPSATTRRSWWRRLATATACWAWRFWCLASLIVLLAVVTAIPLFQLISFGYLLLVSGRLANGNTLRSSLPGLSAAGQIGLTLTALGIASLPTRLMAHWEAVATIVESDSNSATLLRRAAIGFSIAATVYLWWAWARGGRLRHYLWPEPVRFLREAWRPSVWADVSQRLWDFLVSLRLPMLFWLGLRGAIGTLVWLIPAMIIMAVTRDGEDAAAGLVGAICFVLLGIVMLTLPMLQTHFAAENRLRALFAWRTIRRDLRHAPWSVAVAMLMALVLMPIPLYLLKIEATPQEITWLPCLFFVAFMLPARISTGLALRRCRRLHRQVEQGDELTIQRLGSWRHRLSSLIVRFGIVPATVVFYLVVLWASQYTSWDGVDTWVRQHALLVPVPFIGI